jgi:hypothetical protein
MNDVEQLRRDIRAILESPYGAAHPEEATEAILKLIGPFLDEHIRAFTDATKALRAIGALGGIT